MDRNEFNERYKADGTYRALIRASRQLEICGWCPTAKDNRLHNYFRTCELTREDGVWGCHKCIATHFLAKAKAR